MAKNNEQQENILYKKPEQQKGQNFTAFLLLIGSIVILSALLLAGCIHTPSSGASQTTAQSKGSGSQATQSKGSGSQNTAPWDHYPAIYWQTIRTRMAQGLHVSEQQIKSAVQPADTPTKNDPGKPLRDLAAAQGISQEQLHTIEVNAVQQAHAELAKQGVLTQQQADQNAQTIINGGQIRLDKHILNAFLYA